MATFNTQPISQLTLATVLNTNDVIPIVDIDDNTQSPSGTTKKCPLSLLSTFVQSQPFANLAVLGDVIIEGELAVNLTIGANGNITTQAGMGAALTSNFGQGIGLGNISGGYSTNYTLDIGTIVDANSNNYAAIRIPVNASIDFPAYNHSNVGDAILFNFNNQASGTQMQFCVQTHSGNAYPVLLGGLSQTVFTNPGQNYNVVNTDYIVAISTANDAGTVTLPNPTSYKNALLSTPIYVKDEGGNAATNNITVQASGGANIDGASTKIISTNYGFFGFYTNGTQWFTI